MKVCDKCREPATVSVSIPEEGQLFDLCDKHKEELIKLIFTPEKKLFGRKKSR